MPLINLSGWKTSVHVNASISGLLFLRFVDFFSIFFLFLHILGQSYYCLRGLERLILAGGKLFSGSQLMVIS